MNRKWQAAAVTIGLCLFFPNCAAAQYQDNEDTFFSYRRFYLQLDILENASRDGKARGDVKAFMHNLADGIYAISAGEPEKARTKLLRAREIWPEYFGTDFLLARVNEDSGDYELSARFYKSYLDKLKALSEGRYRMSGPLMKGITPYRIEEYGYAYSMVRQRLKSHGIDLSTVRPVYTVPALLRYLIISIMLGLAYAAVAYGVIPRFRRWQDINNPPPGAWACKRCGTYNLDIRLECEKCGAKRVKRS